ncbi:MAG: serine protease, partial [Chloroflexota bacterium]
MIDAPDIVGGQNADPGEYPWQALVIAGPFLCGGSLVEAGWVLTAAHCVYDFDENLINADDITVFLGEYDRSSESNDGTEQKIEVSQVIPYPDYRPGYHEHDIALLKLSSLANTSSPAVGPIPLNSDRSISPSTLATVTGWGQLVLNGENPSILQEVQVPIVPNQTCNIAYGGSITASMICAGEEEGGKDACLGDSGGPLVIPDGQNSFKHAGIVSFGIGCADPRYPGVYTRTSTYFTWLINTMGINPEPSPIPTETVQVTRTPSPTFTPVPNATETPTPFFTATPTNTPTPSPTPLVSIELISNGMFDDPPLGQGWLQASTNDFTLIDSRANFDIDIDPASAPYFVWLGGRENEESRISQSVTLPGNGRLSLRYRYLVTSIEDRCGFDVGRILINTTIVQTIDLCRDNAAPTWREGFLILDQYGNRNVTLSIEALNDVSDVSSLFIDDVSVLYEADVAPIPSPTPVLSGGNAILNGDFENGNDQFWQVDSENGLQIILSDANTLPLEPVSGNYFAWL